MTTAFGPYGLNPHYSLAETPYARMTGQFTPLDQNYIPNMNSMIQPTFVDMNAYYGFSGVPRLPSFIGGGAMMHPENPIVQPGQFQNSGAYGAYPPQQQMGAYPPQQQYYPQQQQMMMPPQQQMMMPPQQQMMMAPQQQQNPLMAMMMQLMGGGAPQEQTQPQAPPPPQQGGNTGGLDMLFGFIDKLFA